MQWINKDINGIMSHLAPDCRLVLEKWGEEKKDIIAATSSEIMKPDYIRDFQNRNHALVVLAEPIVSKAQHVNGKETENIRILLMNGADGKVLDVSYIIRTSDGMMVAHVLHSVRDGNEEENALRPLPTDTDRLRQKTGVKLFSL